MIGNKNCHTLSIRGLRRETEKPEGGMERRARAHHVWGGNSWENCYGSVYIALLNMQAKGKVGLFFGMG